ncbi:MAG: hypothetical protein K2N06_09435 [Oscillospiraceae bacterium]|nr:hypothetical protein [Oscillospiraceae bacterium]
MKGLGIFLVGALAVAGGIAAATYITKKKLDKENEENYYDDWDSDDIDDDWDYDFDEDMDVEDEPSLAKAVADAVPEVAAEETADEATIPEESVSFGGDIFGSRFSTDDGSDEL